MKKLLLSVVVIVLIFSSAAAITEDDLTDSIRQYYYKAIRVPFHSPPPTMWYLPDHMVIKLNVEPATPSLETITQTPLTGLASLDDLNKKYGVTVMVREFPDLNRRLAAPPTAITSAAGTEELRKYYILKFSEKHRLTDVQRAYSMNEHVDLVQPVGAHPIMEQIPNDPRFLTDQWNFLDPEDNDVDATDAWDLETGDASIIIGDLDTGIQYNVRDLGGPSPYTNGNVWINEDEYNGTPGVDDDGNGYTDDWVGWDFVDNISGAWPGEDADTPDNEPTDFNGHGTHIAGIIAAMSNNSIAVAGLAGGWGEPGNGVKVMALRIGWSGNYGGQEVGYVRMDFAAQAIYYAVNKGVTAINCSWGSSNSGGLGAAIDYAVANGVVVVHAAGNDGNQVADYLGSRTDVLNVAATDDSDIKASFSNYGTWVDLAAPGVDILSTYSYHYNPNYIAWVSGTSQAAPHVTAAAGLLKSYDPSLTRQEMFDLIVDYTDNIDAINPAYAGRLGSGRLNVFKSLDAAAAPTVTVIQPNGGEVLYIGQQYDIMWDADDNVGIDSTLIDYSVDSGQNFWRIATLVGNPGIWTWTVTGPPSSTCRVRVTCYDAVGRTGSDMSDEDFCPPGPPLLAAMMSGTGQRMSIVAPEDTPDRYALYHNRPNPFNPSTSIKYALKESGRVRLDVYNVLGQKIATLVDEHQSAGYKSVTFDASDLASGMYFYRLQAGSFVQTKKMLLMK